MFEDEVQHKYWRNHCRSFAEAGLGRPLNLYQPLNHWPVRKWGVLVLRYHRDRSSVMLHELDPVNSKCMMTPHLQFIKIESVFGRPMWDMGKGELAVSWSWRWIIQKHTNTGRHTIARAIPWTGDRNDTCPGDLLLKQKYRGIVLVIREALDHPVPPVHQLFVIHSARKSWVHAHKGKWYSFLQTYFSLDFAPSWEAPCVLTGLIDDSWSSHREHLQLQILHWSKWAQWFASLKRNHYWLGVSNLDINKWKSGHHSKYGTISEDSKGALKV